MNNVIQFPDKGVVPSELKVDFEKNKKRFIDGYLNKLMQGLYTEISMEGFDIDSEEFIRYFSYSGEVLRAGLYLSADLKHPLHDILHETPEL